MSLDKTLYDIKSPWWLRTSSKDGGQDFKEIHWNVGSLLNMCGFFQARSSHCKEMCADLLVVTV